MVRSKNKTSARKRASMNLRNQNFKVILPLLQKLVMDLKLITNHYFPHTFL